MSLVLGIDTGGTYTDAVLLDSGNRTILYKTKAFTTKHDLTIGINECLNNKVILEKCGEIAKVVLSTTLATNAIVEGKGRESGLIMIGREIKEEIPTRYAGTVSGSINIKGRELKKIDPAEVLDLADKIIPHVESLAISGLMSTRNAAHELEVKRLIQEKYNIPIICGHELTNVLGYYERTVTAVLNAQLLPVIKEFIDAMTASLGKANITAPIYIVKGTGSIARLQFVKERPIDTLLSGPAASMMGALYLSGEQNAIVIDMGGTTTDSASVKNNQLKFTKKGAEVGGWQTRIESADIHTYGIGGDTGILIENGKPIITQRRYLPACRGGKEAVTPTDIVHYTGEYEKWDVEASRTAVHLQAEKCSMSVKEYLETVQTGIKQTIIKKVLNHYEGDTDPVIAIGAPAKTWYTKIKNEYGYDVIVPDHYEVANAVGAAVAEIVAEVDAVVRKGEDKKGFLLHIEGERYAFTTRDDAIQFGLEKSKHYVIELAKAQGAKYVEAVSESRNRYVQTGSSEEYVETIICAKAQGRNVEMV